MPGIEGGLSGAKTEAIQSSFVAETGAVETMLALTQKGWPAFWYELLQGAIDYNDWEQGPPSIVCIADDGTNISLQEYIDNPGTQIKRVDVKNFIQGDKGLTPDNVLFSAHKGGEGTLGMHGQGLSVGSAACLVGNLCEGITFQSRDENGSWVGQGVLGRAWSEQKDESFGLEFTKAAREVGETVISVKAPSKELLTALHMLPWGFLLGNSNYEFSALEAKQASKIANLLTVYADSQGLQTGSAEVFSDEEFARMGLSRSVFLSLIQKPRVEILADELVERDQSERTTTSVFSGGLRLSSYGASYALNWSFYGFDQAARGFRVGRSSDSLYITANPTSLIESALRKCSSPEVFLRIFKACLDGNRCAEGEIKSDNFENLDLGVEGAIFKAWEDLTIELGLGRENVYITTSARLKERAQSEGFKVILLSSQAFVDVLTRNGVKSIEEALGVMKESEGTGERMRVNRLGDDFHMTESTRYFIGALALCDGKVTKNEQGKLEISLGPEAMQRFMGQFHELHPNLALFVKYFTPLLGNAARSEIIVDDGGKAINFEFTLDRAYEKDAARLVEVVTQKGEVVSSSVKGVRINLSILNPAVMELFEEFRGRISQDLANIVGSDGNIDIDKYLDYSRDSGDRMEMILMRKRKEMEALTGAIERTLEQLGLSSTHEGRMPLEKWRMGRKNNDVAVNRGMIDTLTSVHEDKSAFLQILNTAFRRYFSPDVALSMIHGGRPGLIEYFVESIQAPYSDVSINQYVGLTDIEHRKRTGLRELAFNRTLPSGTYPIFGLLGYRPVSYYTSGGQRISFLELPGKNMWAVSSEQPIAAGFKIYFDRVEEVDKTMPDAKELMELVDSDKLSSHWQDLTAALRADEKLSDKQKVDILLDAWYKAFTYNSEFRYPESDDAQRLTAIVNNAEGVCGESARGFMVLAREAGIPTRMLSGRMTKFGRLVTGEDEHAFDEAYIDGNWVTVEPQGGLFHGYLEEGLNIGVIPEDYKRFLDAIPRKRFVLKERMTFIKKTAALLGAPFAAGLGATVFVSSKLGELLRINFPISESSDRARIQLPEWLGFFANAGSRISDSIPPSPLTNVPLPDINFADHPEYLVIGALTGAIPLAMKFAGERTQKRISRQLEENLKNIRIEQERKEKENGPPN